MIGKALQMNLPYQLITELGECLHDEFISGMSSRSRNALARKTVFECSSLAADQIRVYIQKPMLIAIAFCCIIRTIQFYSSGDSKTCDLDWVTQGFRHFIRRFGRMNDGQM
jgi:hypothetical protein